MVYNLTPIDATNTTLEFMQEGNNLSGNLIGNGFIIVFWLIGVMLIYRFTNSLGKSILGISFPAFIISGSMFLVAGLIDWYLPIFFLAMTIVGIILQTKRDNYYG